MESAEIFEHLPGFFCHKLTIILQNVKATTSRTSWSFLLTQLRQGEAIHFPSICKP